MHPSCGKRWDPTLGPEDGCKGSVKRENRRPYRYWWNLVTPNTKESASSPPVRIPVPPQIVFEKRMLLADLCRRACCAIALCQHCTVRHPLPMLWGENVVPLVTSAWLTTDTHGTTSTVDLYEGVGREGANVRTNLAINLT